jgi:beta-glucosidase
LDSDHSKAGHYRRTAWRATEALSIGRAALPQSLMEERMALFPSRDSNRIGRAIALTFVCAVPVIGIGIARAAPPENSQAGGKVHVVEARVKPIIGIGQLEFRDLNGNGQLDVYEDWRKPVERRVADLLSRMSLEEKAGLMQITSFSATTAGGFINDRHIAHLILRDGVAGRELALRNNRFQQIAEGTRLGIPLVFAANPRDHISDALVFEQVDATGQWPGTLGLAATNDIKLVRAFADTIRGQWVAQGIRKMYGYQVDVASEPRWNRVQTTFGEGPWWNAAITREIVLGFQGQHLGPDSVAETIKHFPGDGAVWNGLDPHNSWGQYAAYPTTGSLFQYQLPPFQAAVDAGTSAIMSYYNSQINSRDAVQLPSSWWQSPTQQFEEVGGAFNKTLLTTLLRDTMGFTGYVNTDSGVLGNTGWGVESLTTAERFAKGVKAGASIFSDNNDPSQLIVAVQTGLLTEGELDPHVSRLLTEMFNLGLFEQPYVDPDAAQASIESQEALNLQYQANLESIVLLRNETGLLPLAAGKKVYAEVFAGTRSATQTAALKALLAAEPAVTVVDTVDQADVALVWLRPTVFQRPQHDYNEVALGTNTGVDVAKVQAIEAAKPTVLVVNVVNPWVINAVEPNAAAVVATFDVKGGALLDVLTGRYNPSGKLPLSIPADQAAVDNNAPDVPGYLESFDYAYRNKVGDKYLFGFGMSYGR